MAPWTAKRLEVPANGSVLECVKVPAFEEPRSEKVIISTGIFAGAPDYVILTTYFAGDGYDTYILGHRSHGIADPSGFVTYTAFDDFSRGVDYLDSVDNRTSLLIGHSYGGKMVARYVTENSFHPEGVRAAVACGTPRSLGKYVDQDVLYKMARNPLLGSLNGSLRSFANGIAEWFFPNFRVRDGCIKIRELYEPEWRLYGFLDSLDNDDDVVQRAAVAGPPVTPTLMLHGENDRLIEPRDTFELAETTGQRAFLIPGIGHRLEHATIRDFRRISRGIMAFFDDPYVDNVSMQRYLDGTCKV